MDVGQARLYMVQETNRLALQLGVKNVTVIFNNRLKRVIGRCNKKQKKIQYNSEFVRLNKDDREALRNIVVHEVAHLKVNGHTDKFYKVCRNFGVNFKNRHVKKGIIPKGSYKGTCAVCGKVIQYYRKPKLLERSCAICYPKGYNSNYPIIITKNKD